jgi:hypothetical protein
MVSGSSRKKGCQRGKMDEVQMTRLKTLAGQANDE